MKDSIRVWMGLWWFSKNRARFRQGMVLYAPSYIQKYICLHWSININIHSQITDFPESLIPSFASLILLQITMSLVEATSYHLRHRAAAARSHHCGWSATWLRWILFLCMCLSFLFLFWNTNERFFSFLFVNFLHKWTKNYRCRFVHYGLNFIKWTINEKIKFEFWRN